MSSSRSASVPGDDKADKDEVVPNISCLDVAEKYRTAARITNDALKLVTEKSVAGSSVADLCCFGDNYIFTKTGEFAKKAGYKKGIAFPTALSVNNLVAHVAPLRANDFQLADGDVVKLELGAHVDGYIAISAHTFVVGASKENKVTGRKADVILAAYNAAEAAVRMMKVGSKGQDIADLIDKVSDQYKCTALENMLMYCVKQHKIEGETSILINGTTEGRRDHEQPELGDCDVYAVDVLVTTGKGGAKPSTRETSIFKIEQVHYALKSKRSRQFFSYAQQQFGLLPFNLRFFEPLSKDDHGKVAGAGDLERVATKMPIIKGKENKVTDVPEFVTAKLGIKECREHGLAVSFDVQTAEEGEFVAQFKYTVFVRKDKTPERITTIPAFDPELYQSEHSILDEELATLLKEKIDIKKKNKNKKKAAKPIDVANGTAAAPVVVAAPETTAVAA